MKDKLKKILHSKYLPFVLLFIVLFCVHWFAMFFGDDITFSKAKGSIFPLLVDRYTGWSSRLVIELFLIPLAKISKETMVIWKLLDSFIYTLGIYVILRLVNKKEDVSFNYFGCLVALLYSFLEMSEAGWLATTMNYLWCFGFGMFSFLPLINKELGKKTDKYMYILTIFSLIYATNQEQSCAIIFGINLLYLLNTHFIKKEKSNKYNVICTILSFLSLIFILTCPGNAKRLKSETKAWFPNFKKVNIIQKLYFGIVPAMDIILKNQMILILLSILLLVGVFVYSKCNFSKVIAMLNLFLVCSLTIFKNITLGIFTYFDSIFNAFKSQDLFFFNNCNQVVALLISLFIFASLVYMMLVIFKNKLLPVFILLAGIASRVIIGFSPTVFASGARTALFLFMAMIICILFVAYKLFTEKKIVGNAKILLFSSVLFFAVINCVNVVIYLANAWV